MLSIPAKTQVLVIGAGPGGSTASTLLARQGFDVTALEASIFPRYHVGESLLPSVLQIFDLLGAREKLDSAGFQRKQGAFLQWGEEEWPLNFGELSEQHTYAYQVRRADFDQFLLEHARSQGVRAFEGIEVCGLRFDGERPVAATWRVRASRNGDRPQEGEIRFDYLIDASGRNGVISNQHLRNRRYHTVFQNVALWGYWQNTRRLPGERQGDIAVGSIPYGWLWGIPLSDGTMSVGAVMHRDALKSRRGDGLKETLLEAIDHSPLLKDLLEPGELISEIYTETDYSYAADRFCGPGYGLVGDAACFLDPLLSSGVHLAMFSAMLLSAGLVTVRAGEIDESQMMSFYEKSYRQAYLRFLVFLSAFYDVGRGKDSYFWEAQRLTREDVSKQDLKLAFLRLVTGLRDLSDAQSDTHHFVLHEMTRRIDENLRYRQDKAELASLKGDRKDAAERNAEFFSSVEGIFSLNEEEAVDGLYVVSHPRLKLARTPVRSCTGPGQPEETL